MNLFKASLSIIGAGAVVSLGCGGGGGGNDGEECAGNFVAGDLVITEVMANPDGQDEGNEYWEVFNPGSSPVDVTGMVLYAARPDGTDEVVHVMRAATIAPGEYFVVGGVLDEFKAGHVDYGYANDLGSLRNSGGRLGLRCQGTLVDEIEYGEAADGVSLELDGSQAPDAIRNDELANFCNATNEFLPGNFGTPQEANGFCTIIAPGMCNDGGTMRATVQPAAGDVVITEIMPNPEGADGDKEWFEVLALADFDLNGLNAGIEEGNPRAQVDSPDCVPVTAGTHILFAQSLDDTLNAGLPSADGLFGFTLKNGTTATGDGKLVVGIGEETLDVITWTDSTEGAAFNLDPDASDPVANDLPESYCAASQAYGGEGNFGTPQAANSPCVAAGQCVDPDDGQLRAINFPTAMTITEVMTRSNIGAGSESSARWFEVQFGSDGDLNELLVGREGTTNETSITSPNCKEFLAGEHAVIAASGNMADNGLQQIDGTFNFTLVINPGENLFVSADGTVLDAVDYPNTDSGDVGNTQQLDGDGVFCLASEAGIVDAYNGDGDLGTPGAANGDCPAM